jgi:hypothetical protein
MDKPKITPKDFFLWAGAMVALYWSVIAFIFLIFDYINYSFPDPLSYYGGNPYASGISHEMASLIVLFPVYILIMWFVRRDIARDPSRKDIWVRRWALILTLFVAGVTLATDLIFLLTAFLGGDTLTTAFLLKVLTVFLVAGGAFAHFVADLWGYWDANPARKRFVVAGVSILVAASIIAGFFIVGTPAQARLYQLDERKVSDLTNIQWQIVNYWQQKGTLPLELSNLDDPIANYVVPTDPQTNEPYGYEKTGVRTFKLCAVFNADGPRMPQNLPRAARPALDVGEELASNWTHEAGETCFERRIDPDRYPIFKDR